jgi:hypothetical protein
MKRLIPKLRIGILAAVLFWVPDLIVHVARGKDFSGQDVRLLTVLLPVITLLGLWLVSKVWDSFAVDDLGSIVAALGIWFFGPLFIMTSWAIQQGGFISSWLWAAIVLEMALFPIFTFMMSVYDGTLGAVALVTGALLLRALLIWSRRFEQSAAA